MNRNTQTILNHLTGTLLLVDENLNSDGMPNWNNLDADIHCDVADGVLVADLIGEDIDAAFDVVNAMFTKINKAIDNAVADLGLRFKGAAS